MKDYVLVPIEQVRDVMEWLNEEAHDDVWLYDVAGEQMAHLHQKQQRWDETAALDQHLFIDSCHPNAAWRFTGDDDCTLTKVMFRWVG